MKTSTPQIRKLSTESIVAATLSFACFWGSIFTPGHWQPPFWGPVPLSWLPKLFLSFLAVLAGLVAVVAGHKAIAAGRRDPDLRGVRWYLLLPAAVAYLAVPFLAFWSLPGLLRPLVFLFSGFLLPSQFAALVAFVLVRVAVTRVRRVHGSGGITWLPLTGSIIAYMSISLVCLTLLAFQGKEQHFMDSLACRKNLQRLDALLLDYANDHEGTYPPLSSQPGVLMFSPEAIPPTDDVRRLLTCPTVRKAKRGTEGYQAAKMRTPPFGDQSYYYLGYALFSDEDVEAFAQAYRTQIAEGGTFDNDLVVQDGPNTRVLPRLKTGLIERLRLRPALYAGVPILIERGPGHIDPDGATRTPRYRVVYEGRLAQGIESVELGNWPITEKTLGLLEELAGMSSGADAE